MPETPKTPAIDRVARVDWYAAMAGMYAAQTYPPQTEQEAVESAAALWCYHFNLDPHCEEAQRFEQGFRQMFRSVRESHPIPAADLQFFGIEPEASLPPVQTSKHLVTVAAAEAFMAANRQVEALIKFALPGEERAAIWKAAAALQKLMHVILARLMREEQAAAKGIEDDSR